MIDHAVAARRLSVLPMERRVADVCPGCGGHAEPDLGRRLGLLLEGGLVRCAGCGIAKRVEGGSVPEDPGIGKLVKSEGYGAGGWEEPHLGRFRVLKRTDGRFAVYEDRVEDVGLPLDRVRRFYGPVFADVNLAKWRVWWRVEGEKKTGLRLGQTCSVGGSPCELLDFVDERRAGVKFLGSGVVDFVWIVQLEGNAR